MLQIATVQVINMITHNIIPKLACKEKNIINQNNKAEKVYILQNKLTYSLIMI